jgi:hypothetical protein
MTCRPITDVWLLARPKVKYYGAYPSGFLHRARTLLGVGPADAVLHVFSGRVRDYPFKGLGQYDKTVDVDPALVPDFCLDIMTAPLPAGPWAAVLADPPYTPEDAACYGPHACPKVNDVLRACLTVVVPGARVGILHYQWPQPPKHAQEVAVVAVGTGRNQRARWFTVFEKISTELQ